MKLPLFRAARAKLTTSTDVQTEADRHTALLADARSELAQLDGARREVLIGDDVAAIRDHETRASELRIAIARLEARLEALAEQAVEIRATEATAALTARRTAAVTRSAEIENWWRDVYPLMARELIGALQEMQATDNEIRALNDALGRAYRHGEELHSVEHRIAPGSGVTMPLSVLENTRLMEIEVVGAPAWGKALEIPRWV